MTILKWTVLKLKSYWAGNPNTVCGILCLKKLKDEPEKFYKMNNLNK